MKIVYVEITDACNLKCNFCSVGKKPKVFHEKSEAKRFLEEGFRKGFRKAVITGGEPLLSSELEEIIKYAKGVGFEDVGMQTNGTLMSPERALSLKEAGLDQAVFSIHSNISVIVDRTMKGEGVLKKQLEGLVNAEEAGITTMVAVVITRQNYRVLLELFKFMIENYPFVEHYTLNFVDPVGWAKDRKEIVPKYSELEPFLLSSLLLLSDAGKTFRVERVPLCYMLEFAESSTELRRITTNEPNAVKRVQEFTSYTNEYFRKEYVHGEACKSCWLNPVCPGLKTRYADIYGTGEIYPVFVRPEVIVSSAGED